MSEDSNVATIDELLASVSEAAQGFFESSGTSSYKLPAVGDYTILAESFTPGTRKTKNGELACHTLKMQLADAPAEVMEEFKEGFTYSFWGNAFDDHAALKQLAALCGSDFSSVSYVETVKQCAESVPGCILTCTLSKNKNKYDKIQFNDLVGRG